jgi:hypothetical protein
MKEQLILFGTAKLAKEKGFKEDCTHYYNNKTKILKPFMYDDNPKVISIQDGTNLGLLTIAPTQSLLQKWLREKYNIHVEITWVDTLSDIYVYHISTTANAIRPDSIFYHSYEEALEVGLQEALKLI